MKQQASTRYTIRGVPAEVDAALRRKAKRRRISLNRLLVEELAAVASVAAPKADYSDLVGVWQPDAAFDEIIADQRKIDRRKWK
jgi:hypothetical protein